MRLIKKVYSLFRRPKKSPIVEVSFDDERAALERKVLEGTNKVVKEYKEALSILAAHDRS